MTTPDDLLERIDAELALPPNGRTLAERITAAGLTCPDLPTDERRAFAGAMRDRGLSTHVSAAVLAVNQSTVSRDLAALAGDPEPADEPPAGPEQTPDNAAPDRDARSVPQAESHAQTVDEDPDAADPAAERISVPAAWSHAQTDEQLDPFAPDDDQDDDEAVPAVPEPEPQTDRRAPAVTFVSSATQRVDPGASPELSAVVERRAEAERQYLAAQADEAAVTARHVADRRARLDAFECQQVDEYDADTERDSLERAMTALCAAVLADPVTVALLELQVAQQLVAGNATRIAGMAARQGLDVDTAGLAYSVNPVPLEGLTGRWIAEEVNARRDDAHAAVEVRRQAAAEGVIGV